MLDGADLSTSLESGITSIINQDKASIRIAWTGSPVGELKVLVSNDDPKTSPADATFYELNMGADIKIDATETDHVLVFNELPFNLLKLQYVQISGTGTMSATISSKVTGA